MDGHTTRAPWAQKRQGLVGVWKALEALKPGCVGTGWGGGLVQAPRAGSACPSPGKGHLAVLLHDVVVVILG